MSNAEIDPLFVLCRQWRAQWPALVDWLEAELIIDPERPNVRIDQIEDMGVKAKALRKTSKELAIQATKRFKEFLMSPQAVTDFALELEGYFVKLPTSWEDTNRLDLARVKAEVVVDAIENILSSDPQAYASPANDGDKTPIEPKERLILDPLTRTVTLDGRSATIKAEKTFLALKLIVDARGAIVASDDIRGAVPGYRRVKRIDLALNRGMEPWVRALIPGAPGHNGGFYFEMPKVVRKVALSVREKALKR